MLEGPKATGAVWHWGKLLVNKFTTDLKLRNKATTGKNICVENVASKFIRRTTLGYYNQNLVFIFAYVKVRTAQTNKTRNKS